MSAPLVMVVDDEPMLATLIGKLLKTQGYESHVFTDSRLALTAFESSSQDYSAVITDLSMPGLRGDQLARQLLALQPHLPILLCTGFSDQIDAQAAQNMGIRLFLQKPVQPKVLFQALARLLPL